MIRSLLVSLAVVFTLIGGSAPAQAGHLEINPRVMTFRAACYDLDAMVAVVEATQKSQQHFDDTWTAATKAEVCFTGQRRQGVFERVVEQMEWGSNGPVVIVEIHYRNGWVMFTWYTLKTWYKMNPRA